jgi:hypothetical protein
MKKLTLTLLVSAVTISGVFAQSRSSNNHDSVDHDDTIVESFRDVVSQLSMRVWLAPTHQAKKNMRKQFIQRLQVAEKLADRGNFAAAINVLSGLVGRVDSVGKDWLRDDPSTQNNERQAVHSALLSTIEQLRARHAQHPNPHHASTDSGSSSGGTDDSHNQRRGGRDH